MDSFSEEESISSSAEVLLPFWYADNDLVSFKESFDLEEVVSVFFIESVSPEEALPVCLKESLSLEVIFLPKKF